eukprot:10277563-Heterocapsa_arctica.AAC.1
MCVFKNARGWLPGWELPEEEVARLAHTEEREVVLVKRPTRLHIEVETGTAKMPLVEGKRVCTLTSQAKRWSLDAAGT